MSPAASLRRRRITSAGSVGHGAAPLLSPLPVELEQHVVARGELRLDEGACGAVVVVDHPGVLEKFTACRQLLELRLRDEVVLASLDFGGAARAGGVRDREA